MSLFPPFLSDDYSCRFEFKDMQPGGADPVLTVTGDSSRGAFLSLREPSEDALPENYGVFFNEQWVVTSSPTYDTELRCPDDCGLSGDLFIGPPCLRVPVTNAGRLSIRPERAAQLGSAISGAGTATELRLWGFRAGADPSEPQEVFVYRVPSFLGDFLRNPQSDCRPLLQARPGALTPGTRCPESTS